MISSLPTNEDIFIIWNKSKDAKKNNTKTDNSEMKYCVVYVCHKSRKTTKNRMIIIVHLISTPLIASLIKKKGTGISIF